MYISHLDVELHIVPVELVVVVVQQVVSLQSELSHYGVELINQTFHSLMCEENEVRSWGNKKESERDRKSE